MKVNKMSKKELEKQASEIKRIAEESGVQGNYFFLTTFERYQVQLQMLEELEKSLNEDGMLVTKEYVKGRKNVYSSPAVKDYNTTTDSANRTVSTLMKIIRNYNVNDASNDDVEDPLLKIINGDDVDE